MENRVQLIGPGRNWLFAGSLRADKRAAAVLSLIHSAKLNGLDPYVYMRDALEWLPTQPASRIGRLIVTISQDRSDFMVSSSDTNGTIPGNHRRKRNVGSRKEDPMKTRSIVLLFSFLALALAGCASWLSQGSSKQTGSVVDYLYPDAKEVPQLQPAVTYLHPPVRVGIAFVPGGGWGAGLPEPDKERLIERVKASFSQYGYIGSIELIPTEYLRPRGGFTNLDQVARMFNVEVVALLSYDQVQFNDTNALSMLYWTIVGAYIIHGDQYDIQTMVDASVFDVKSHKLLFRAPGLSQVKGSASMTGFSERARGARLEGYNKAVENLIPQLQSALDKFKERIKSDAGYRIENKPGYSGGGDFGDWGLGLVLLMGWITFASRRRKV